jgi:hypothetical protein
VSQVTIETNIPAHQLSQAFRDVQPQTPTLLIAYQRILGAEKLGE